MVSSLSVVHNVISPCRVITVRMVGNDNVSHLSCNRIVYVKSMIGTYYHRTVAVRIYTSNTVVRHIMCRRVLTIPHYIAIIVRHKTFCGIIAYKSICSAKPQTSVCASVYKVKTVTIARLGYVAKGNIIEELMSFDV